MRRSERTEFEWIFRSSYASVLRTTSLILHDRGRAEEVTQDAFLRLCERWRGVQAVEHPEAWVRQVAVRAVGSLAPQQRAVVALFYLDDLSVEDVARHLGVSTSTVKQHLFRARTRLATLLSETVEVTSDADR